MGVSTTTNTEIYNGDGSTPTFSFPVYFFTKADLNVYIYNKTTGAVSKKVLATDYLLTATANAQGLFPSGGVVDFTALYGAPSTNEMVVISRFPIETQNYSLIQNGAISSTAIVQQFDYLTLLVQSLQDQVNRAVATPSGFGPTFSPLFPTDLAVSNPGVAIVPALLPDHSGFDTAANWPTVTGINGAAASAAAAAASALAAAASQVAAAASAASAATSASAASTSATAAAASAAAAAASAASIHGIPVGGSTGQMLAKNTATDYDTGWATPVTSPSSSVDGEIALFSSTTGKVLKRAATTGLLKATAGVLAAAVASTDYIAATTGSAIQKASSGGLTAATPGTDYQVPITSGDGTTTAGALTLATVNGNVGSFTLATITVDAKGRITAASNGSASAGQLNANFTLSGATVPFVCIDGCHYNVATLSLTQVYISMLDSGTSGSTTIQVNQYRSGALQGSATASLAASSGNPAGAHANLSGTLSLLAGDIITVDVNSIAGGTPSELTVEY